MKNGTLGWLAVLLSLACSASPPAGDTCARASDCIAPLTCELGRCRVSCHSAHDCPIGARCLAGAIQGVCSVDGESQCTSSACVSPLRCESDQCRTQCIQDGDCFGGTCVSATCVESISGDDAGITPRDAGSDAGVGVPDAFVDDAGSDAFVVVDAAVEAGTDAFVDDAGSDAADDMGCDGC